jgi:hypothetical protein
VDVIFICYFRLQTVCGQSAVTGPRPSGGFGPSRADPNCYGWTIQNSDSEVGPALGMEEGSRSPNIHCSTVSILNWIEVSVKSFSSPRIQAWALSAFLIRLHCY